MERGVSAYFSYSSQEGKVVIEWGKINPQNSTAKLHDFLNSHIDYIAYYRRGFKICSGHLALAEADQKKFYLALLDSLSGEEPVGEDKREFGVVKGLWENKILPLSSDGFPKLTLEVSQQWQEWRRARL